MRRPASFFVLALAVGSAACSDTTGPLEETGAELALAVVGPEAVSQAELDALGEAFDRVDEYRVRIAGAQSLEVFVDTMFTITPGGVQHTLNVRIPEVALGRTVTVLLIAYDDGRELYRSTSTTTLGRTVQSVSLQLQIRYTGPGIRGRVTTVGGSGLSGVNVNLYAGQTIVDAVSTEPDGTYLVLDVPNGSYQVVPTTSQALPYACPFGRDVLVQSPSDAIVADFSLSVDPCGTSVLVLSGGDIDDTQVVGELLANDPNLTISTFFYVNQLPSLDFVNQHDVVLLFMNGLFDESAALGNRVREYVDAGGNLVLASFYWQGRSDSGKGSVGWGGVETIDPFTSTGGANYDFGTMETVAAHPLTNNVVFVSANSYWGGAAAKASATVVATWDDGSPFIGYRVLPGGQRIVAVTLFPAAGQAVFGDVQALWENAVNWAGAAGGPNP